MSAFKAATMDGDLLPAMAGPAFAFQNPSLVVTIDAALADAAILPAAEADEFKALSKLGQSGGGTPSSGSDY